jgi:phospholipase/carboxylesterase
VPIAIEADIFEYRDWVYRFRPSNIRAGQLLVMLHGWTGDENSMWIFTRIVPEQMAVIAPRAPNRALEGGYSWRDVIPGTWGLPSLDDLRPSAEILLDFLDDWAKEANLNAGHFDLMGFSQGAALAYVVSLLHPERVRLLVALSGFLPHGSETFLSNPQLAGKPVFISHGRADDMVRVDRAREAEKFLKGAGAETIYCETEGGHKVSRDCMKGLKSFLQAHNKE